MKQKVSNPSQRGSAWPWEALETKKAEKTIQQRVPSHPALYFFVFFSFYYHFIIIVSYSQINTLLFHYAIIFEQSIILLLYQSITTLLYSYIIISLDYDLISNTIKLIQATLRGLRGIKAYVSKTKGQSSGQGGLGCLGKPMINYCINTFLMILLFRFMIRLQYCCMIRL